MKGLPRLLPLVAVAIGGVLAINAVENGPGIIGAARTFAEGVAKPDRKTPSVAADAPDGSAASAISSPASAPARPAPVCAPTAAELAKEAGLSPAELQVLQSLGDRRGQLDQREQGLSTELALLAAAEAKLDAKLATMNALKADMQGLLGQADAKQDAEVDRLVKVFEAMKPEISAARFVLLDDAVRLPIAAKMKERVLSAMIGKMDPKEAKRLTESLAQRYVAQAAAARQAMATPQAAATPAPAPVQTAQAAPAPAPTASPAAAAKPKPVHRRPPAKPRTPAPGLASTAPPSPHAAPSAPSQTTAQAAPKPATTSAAPPAAKPAAPPVVKPPAATAPTSAPPAAAAPPAKPG